MVILIKIVSNLQAQVYIPTIATIGTTPYDVWLLYENGKGTKKDLEKAFYWLSESAKNGNEFVQFDLGEYYQLGIGVEKDEAKAFEYYKKSNENLYNKVLALLYQNDKDTGKDLKKTIYCYNKVAEIAYLLGVWYQSGIEIEKDEVKAFEYYKQSAEKGYNKAQKNLASLYENGEGTKKDLDKAFYWYNKAVENEYEEAQCNLGGCYLFGRGVEKDKDKAFEYYKQSAEKGYIKAQNDLGYLYVKGEIWIV